MCLKRPVLFCKKIWDIIKCYVPGLLVFAHAMCKVEHCVGFSVYTDQRWSMEYCVIEDLEEAVSACPF